MLAWQTYRTHDPAARGQASTDNSRRMSYEQGRHRRKAGAALSLALSPRAQRQQVSPYLLADRHRGGEIPHPARGSNVAGGSGLTPWFPSMAGSCRSVLLEQAPIRRAEVSSILFSSPRVFLCAASFLERSRLRLAWDEDSEEEKTGRQTEEA